MLPQQPDSLMVLHTLPDTLKESAIGAKSLPGFPPSQVVILILHSSERKIKTIQDIKKYPEYQEAFKNFETDGEGDIDDDEAIDWSNSDEENENIDDNEN
ncbi:hypothetical protein EVAR_50254_1 [Eumeta japonica]|uniref:Uncharacterized protein n=1 Tax=Eumeta variegata TaxID=151549 RepID=A0A4C1SKH6_EUMVA|nr:hypothetical protein EVAR_50254_1 [Eumeta japonica]